MSILCALISVGLMLWGTCTHSAPIVLDNALYTDSTTRAFSSSNPLTARGSRASSMVYDAQGRAIFFPATPPGARVPRLIIVAPGKTLTLQNVTLVGFRPEHVYRESSTSAFFLGNNVVVSLERDLDWNSTLTFLGNSIINGNGKVLSFADKAGIAILQTSSVRITDCVLKGVKNFRGFGGAPGVSIACSRNDGRIILDSVRCVFDAAWTFTSGLMNIGGDVSFTSSWATVSYTSVSPVTVWPNSSLTLSGGITFGYASTASQNKFVLTDATSALVIRNSSLTSSSLGLVLSAGSLFMKGDVLFKNVATDPRLGITLDGSLFAALLSGSTMSIDGLVAHGKAA